MPRSPAFLNASTGKCCDSSHSIRCGLISLSAKSRTICAICNCSSVRRKSIQTLLGRGGGGVTMNVPSRVERAQLRRFTGRRDLQSIDTTFRELVFRTTDDTVERLFPGRSRPPFGSNNLATNRHNHWLIDLRMDVDAGISAAMASRDALATTVAMKTADFDWLDYDYDWNRGEEVQLIHWTRGSPEAWQR